MSVGRRLAAALARSAAAVDATITVLVKDSVFWASGLFEGERHILRAEGTLTPALAAWILALPDLDLPIAGQCVEDVAITAHDRVGPRIVLTIEALTIVSVD